MRKLLLILLTVVFALSLFACSNTKSSQNNKDTVPMGTPMRAAYDTFIQDSNGIDKCFWDDGQVKFDDFNPYLPYRQNEKSAILSVQSEYDMWFNMLGDDLDLKNYYAIDFEYDEAKIEITANPNKENHFILKVLQPCDNEKIIIGCASINTLDGSTYGRGTFPVTISTDE